MHSVTNMDKVKLHIFTPKELNHSSYPRTGFFELESMGVLNVAIRCHCKRNEGTLLYENNEWQETPEIQTKTSFYEVLLPDNRVISFALDLFDFDSRFSMPALNTCDFVFKRNFNSELVESLPQKFRSKVFPLGLTFGVKSSFSRGKKRLCLGLYCHGLKKDVKFDRFLFRRIKKSIIKSSNHWRFIKTTRMLDQFDHYQTSEKQTILFQTRCFEEKTQDTKEIHEQRYHLILALRKNFPDTFLGGFVPSDVSKKRFGDALTNVPTEPKAYLETVKNSKIVIYTRGLAHSPAWKMAEYLSQGKVIMAEPLTTDLPAPLEDGVHVMYFNNEAQLVANIKEVQGNKALAQKLAANARAYYEAYVHPTRNMERILNLMIAQ